jgi:hypothetical protein
MILNKLTPQIAESVADDSAYARRLCEADAATMGGFMGSYQDSGHVDTIRF